MKSYTTDAYLICPLRLLSERTWGEISSSLIYATWDIRREDEEQAIAEWLQGVWAHWTDHWNSVPASPEHDAIAEWRGAILQDAFS